jgi:hypothetical protein
MGPTRKNPRFLGYAVLVDAAKLNLSGKTAERKEKGKDDGTGDEKGGLGRDRLDVTSREIRGR